MNIPAYIQGGCGAQNGAEREDDYYEVQNTSLRVGEGLKVTRAFRATWYAIVCLKHRRVCSSDSLEH